MIFPKTIQDGEAVIRWNPNGTRDLITGPKTIFAPFARVQPLARFNAAEGEYLVITFRDGHTEHRAGPCHLWFDPLLHANILTKKATHLDAHEAIVIYTKMKAKSHTAFSTDPLSTFPLPPKLFTSFNGTVTTATGKKFREPFDLKNSVSSPTKCISTSAAFELPTRRS